MWSFSDQMEEIKTLIRSNSKQNKSNGYSSLLHLQQQSNDLPFSSSSSSSIIIKALSGSSGTLISSISIDISNDDEEIAARALKCLGFMIYHPCIVSSIKDGDATMILENLVNLILTTKMKAVCNLSVWCISVQQFDAAFLIGHYQSLLQAVVHALDNPFGSLSTTFEAIQVVMKLAPLLSEKMRESSFLWVPPICRRLLSTDKRERDMSERCLSNVKLAIFPPPTALCKALVKDLKWKLLTEMKDLLKQGKKVPTLQAWGWLIRLLGSLALKNRHLINDMLKIPEQTFSDQSPQVQIASQVAWEGLIDTLIQPRIITSETTVEGENGVQQLRASNMNGCQFQKNVFTKSLKLLMTPLVGIISSQCDTSVHLSCLNTWCYLLHKLDFSINHPLVIDLVLAPVFKAVFEMGPDSKTVLLWSLCLDLLDNFIAAKCGKSESSIQHSSVATSTPGHLVSGRGSMKQHPIKWFPWGIGELDLLIKIITIIISHASNATITAQNRSLAYDSALRIFRSVLKGVQLELKSSSITYVDIMLLLNTILMFVKETCQNLNSCGSCDDDDVLQHASIQFLQAVIDEIEPAVLGSPLYKVCLDLEFIKNRQSVNDGIYDNILGISSTAYMDMISPLVYLIILSIHNLIQPNPCRSRTELIPTNLCKFFKLILFSYDPMENLRLAIGLLYKFVGCRNLKIWTAMAEALRDCIDGVKDISFLTMEPNGHSYIALHQLLSYPFSVWSSRKKMLAQWKVSCSLEESSAHGNLELEHVIEVWKSVYGALATAMRPATKNISNNLCLMLNRCIDENLSMTDSGKEVDFSSKFSDLDFLSLYGNAAARILEEIVVAFSDGNQKNQDEHLAFSNVESVLRFVSTFLKLSSARIQMDQQTGLPVTSRVFSALACLASHLHLKHDVLSAIEIISYPVIQWLSCGEIPDGHTDELQHLLAEIFDSLRRSRPPIVFDSSFLKLQAPLLAKTLGHRNSAISELAITFWNLTFGEQIKLDYPETLLDILHKLSRNKRINIHKKSLPFLMNCNSIAELPVETHRVTATHTGSSKRVELLQDAVDRFGQKDNFRSGSKRKGLELTEHQKEVRRAQQGRLMDCSGHGPGVRTYTNVDFSQGTEDSQDSRKIRNPESILEMLKRGV